jgi:acyl-CoA thioesterase-1
MGGLFKRIVGLLVPWALCATLAVTPMHASAADGTAGKPAPIRILGLGDSLMQGYGLPPGTDFPTKLAQALKARGLDATVINAGVSGDTSAGGLARLDWSLTDRPDAAIVEFGANDALRGLPPADMERNLDGILAKLKAHGIPVLLAGMMSPRNMGPAYAEQFDAVFPRLAKKYGALLYPFFLDGVALHPEYVQPDGLHPNPEGVEMMVARITPMVMELAAKAKAARADGNAK